MSEKKDLVKNEEKSIGNTHSLRSVVPAVDIYENNDEILLHADMPGVAKDKLSVNINNGTLSLSGVRQLDRSGVSSWEELTDVEYTRKFSVSQNIDMERVEAEFKNGVLELHLPKAEAAKPKMIEIKAA